MSLFCKDADSPAVEIFEIVLLALSGGIFFLPALLKEKEERVGEHGSA